jgi:lipid-binding SYLF domain-containing protein
MKKHLTKSMVLGAICFLFVPTAFLRAADMHERIHTAIEILDRKQNSAEPIPAHLLNHAKGIAIFTITKGGLGIGGQGGEGIVIVRLVGMASHSWTAPSAFNLGGASIGAQIGFTEVRYIVVLNTDDAVRHFTSPGKMNWDATASGTVGSSTGTEKLSTTELEHREIVVYKDSGGVFGGATFGGTSIERKDKINREAYGAGVREKNILNGTVAAPKSASRLYELLDDRA